MVADNDDPSEAADRLERALERIAALAAPVGADSPGHAIAPAGTESSVEVARRLDALIGRIRSVLGPNAGG